MDMIGEDNIVGVGMKNLVETGIDSYQVKVEQLARFMEEATELTEQISREEDQLAMELRGVLARWQYLRRKDFNLMYSPIMESRGESCTKVKRRISA